MGVIVTDLSLGKQRSDRYKEFNSIEEAVEIIKKVYHENGVCLGELLASIAINECCLEDVLTIIAKARKEIDDYDMIIRIEDDYVNLLDGSEYEL